MSIQGLTPPQDITWTRMLFSRDMMDEKPDFRNLFELPPRWRSSFAVYQYIVPEEETVDAYPNSRIVYLKLSCSITGWNPSETLVLAQKEASELGRGDDLQITLWEAITAAGWAEKYWPCLGAVMQLAIYPHNTPDISIEDYPYIMDFEPKKRELYESLSEGSEVLSGSSDKTSITNGSTSVVNKEASLEAGFSVFGIGVDASGKIGKQDTSINQKVTDTLKEARETLSRTTTSSQMYQLFNGYHLGTNRGLFAIAPRPHTVSGGEQIEASLINGERKLEGIQDIFIVVHMPRTLNGFCVLASLDTGHLADADTTDEHLVITRRMARGCGNFDDSGNFLLQKLEEPPILIMGELTVERTKAFSMRMAPSDSSKKGRMDAANNLNQLQSRITQKIVDKISAGNYKPRKFIETSLFKKLALKTIIKNPIGIKQLVSKKILSKTIGDQLLKKKITNLEELFSKKSTELGSVNPGEIGDNIINYLTTTK